MSEEKTKYWPTIVAAIVTGIFTIAAGFVTYWYTSEEPSLSYSISGGPQLSGSTETKRIYVVEIKNTGDKEVINTLAQVKLPKGKIEDTATEASPGVNLTEAIKPKVYSLTADILNPEEFLKVSFLITSSSSELEPQITVRAPGVKAKSISSKKEKADKSELIILLASTVGAMLSVSLLLSPFLKKIGFWKIIARVAGSPLEQNELVSYICAQSGLLDESEKYRFSTSKASYRGAADYLMHRAASSEKNKSKCIAAIKAMLLIEPMNPVSKDSMKQSLKILLEESYDEEEINGIINESINEAEDPAELRVKIDHVIAADLNEDSQEQG